MQISALRDKTAREGAREGSSTPAQSTPTHIVHIPSSEPDAPRKAVRVNRAMMRRLRRLVRLRGASYFDGPSVGDECRRLGLTLRQYQDYLIRCQGYSRVRVYGLDGAALLWCCGQYFAACCRVMRQASCGRVFARRACRQIRRGSGS